MSQTPPRALVVLRVARGATAPDARAIRDAIVADRTRLSLTPTGVVAWRVAGPYAIEVDGQALDEYVAWEV